MSGAPKIPDGPEGNLIRGYFVKARLDPNNPDDWPKLVLSLGGKLGAPRKWDEEMRKRLFIEASRIQAEHGRKHSELPPLSEMAVCQQLELSGKFPGNDWDALRRPLRRMSAYVIKGLAKHFGIEFKWQEPRSTTAQGVSASFSDAASLALRQLTAKKFRSAYSRHRPPLPTRYSTLQHRKRIGPTWIPPGRPHCVAPSVWEP